MDHFAKVASDAELKTMLSAAVQAVHAEEGSILLLDHTGRSMRFVICESRVPESLLSQNVPVANSISGLAVNFQQSMIVNDVQSHTEFYGEIDQKTSVTTRSLMVVPLSTDRAAFGVLTAINSQSETRFGHEDLERYQAAAANIAARLDGLDLGMDYAADFE